MVIFNSSLKGCIISLRIQMFMFILRGNGAMRQMLQRWLSVSVLDVFVSLLDF